VYGRSAIRRAGLLLCLASLAAPAAAVALAKSNPGSSCNAHRNRAVVKTQTVIVYHRPSGLDNYSGGYLTTYDACLRPGGRPVPVGQSSTAGEYPGNYGMYQLRIAGTFVADLSASGFASEAACSKYGGTDCQQNVSWWVEAADARSRRTAHVPVPGDVRAVTVSGAGAVAWIVPGSGSSATLRAIAVHPVGRRGLTGTVRTLDRGVIGSLRITGLTVRWDNGGQAKTRTLR
jgi:hypothetical protein